MALWLLISAGGALGALARYGLGAFVASRASPSFPLGTLLINGLGSFLIGLVMVLVSETSPAARETQALLVTGVLGGFTTFSTYEYESLQLATSGSHWRLSFNLVGNVILGLAAAWLGAAAGKLIGR